MANNVIANTQYNNNNNSMKRLKQIMCPCRKNCTKTHHLVHTLTQFNTNVKLRLYGHNLFVHNIHHHTNVRCKTLTKM